MSTAEGTTTMFASLVKSGDDSLVTLKHVGSDAPSVAHHIRGGFDAVDAYLSEFGVFRTGEWKPASDHGYTAACEWAQPVESAFEFPCPTYAWCDGHDDVNTEAEGHMGSLASIWSSVSTSHQLRVGKEANDGTITYSAYVDTSTSGPEPITLDGLTTFAVELEAAASALRAYVAAERSATA